MKKTIKHLRHRSGSYYGVIGEDTGFGYLKVGDVVAYVTENGVIVSNFVAKRDTGVYGVMGKFSTPFEQLQGLTKILSHKDVNESAYERVSASGGFYIQEIEVTQMTIAQIEAKLGYPIEIVQ